MKSQSVWKKNVGHLINATENFAKGNIGMKNYEAFIKMISADFKKIDFRYEKIKDIYILNFIFHFRSNAYPIWVDLEVNTKTKEADVITIQQ